VGGEGDGLVSGMTKKGGGEVGEKVGTTGGGRNRFRGREKGGKGD